MRRAKQFFDLLEYITLRLVLYVLMVLGAIALIRGGRQCLICSVDVADYSCIHCLPTVSDSRWSLLLLRCPPLLLGEADPSPPFGTHPSHTGSAAGALALAVQGGDGLVDAVSLVLQLADDSCGLHGAIVQDG